jgi:methylglutaconyl-CoA hydratase
MTEHAYQTIEYAVEGQVAWVFLNRPEVHNAFNKAMICELIRAFQAIKNDVSIRVAVLTGRGKSFCAGADLKWMKEIVNYSFEDNLKESLQIADLHQDIYTLPKPTIAMVNGTAIGGGTGLLSACDISIASEDARFGLSEVKLGLVPAAISPYVVRRIGETHARKYILTGTRIGASEAREIGLLNEVIPLERLESRVRETVSLLLSSGPRAMAKSKELLLNVPQMNLDEAREYTARMIADLRISEEGQEGMAAFLEKRKPKWVK